MRRRSFLKAMLIGAAVGFGGSLGQYRRPVFKEALPVEGIGVFDVVFSPNTTKDRVTYQIAPDGRLMPMDEAQLDPVRKRLDGYYQSMGTKKVTVTPILEWVG